jgi:hypothetical protein
MANKMGTCKPTRRDVLGALAGAPLATLPLPAIAAGRTGLQRKAPEVFLKGVWLQPISTMATWAERGVNTLVHGCADAADEKESAEEWDAAAAAHGFRLIRRPGRQRVPVSAEKMRALLQADDANPMVIAWNLPDEPNLFHGTPPYKPMTKAQLASLVTIYRAASGTKPIHVNLSGYNNMFGGGWDFYDIADIDWYSTDIYPSYPPSKGGLPFLYAKYIGNRAPHYTYISTFGGVLLQNHIQQAHAAGETFDRVVYTGARGKPAFSFVSTSNFRPESPAPTPAQFRAECWSRVINGAAGIFYFPQRIKPTFAFDNTPPDLVREMAVFHHNIDLLADEGMLMNKRVGGRKPYRLRQCPVTTNPALNHLNNALDPAALGAWKPPSGDQLPGPFEGIEVDAGAEQYRLVLNLAGVASALTDTRWGLNARPFGPYEVQCFKASAPTRNILRA